MPQFKFGMIILIAGLIIGSASNLHAQRFDTDTNPSNRERFEEALSDSITRLERLIRRNPTRIRNINTSIKETIQAAKIYGEGGNSSKALSLVLSAQKKYSDNVLSYLIASELYDEKGETQKANQARIQFLKKCARAPWMARETMSWENRQAFFDYVAGKLRQSDIEPPKFKTRTPLIQQVLWEKGNHLQEGISTALPILVCVGLVFYIFRIMLGYDVSIERPNRIALQFYCLIVALYLLWMLHLFMNLDPIIDPVEIEILAAFFGGSALILLMNLAEASYQRWKELRDPESQECPYCHKIIARIVTECPYCGKKVG